MMWKTMLGGSTFLDLPESVDDDGGLFVSDS